MVTKGSSTVNQLVSFLDNIGRAIDSGKEMSGILSSIVFCMLNSYSNYIKMEFRGLYCYLVLKILIWKGTKGLI